mmetsp:Transcript_27484/g.29652  ORF Transcript_27484/g.29652 Transcript_27484/m.29652 type:complete len:88 (-) Transcript_27484:1236-1499(-)
MMMTKQVVGRIMVTSISRGTEELLISSYVLSFDELCYGIIEVNNRGVRVVRRCCGLIIGSMVPTYCLSYYCNKYLDGKNQQQQQQRV